MSAIGPIYSTVPEQVNVLRNDVMSTGAEITGIRDLEWTCDITQLLEDAGVLFPTPNDNTGAGDSGSNMDALNNPMSTQADAMDKFLNTLKATNDASGADETSIPDWYSEVDGNTKMHFQVRDGLDELFEASFTDGNELNSSTGSRGTIVLDTALIRSVMKDSTKDLNSNFFSRDQLQDILEQAADYGLAKSVTGGNVFSFTQGQVLAVAVDVIDETMYNKTVLNGQANLNVNRWIVKLIQA
jgi:hypothetical protein